MNKMMVGLMLLLSGASAFAQSAPTTETRGEMRAQMRERMLDRLVARLGLDEAGAAQLKATFVKYGEQLKPLRKNARQTSESLRAAVAANDTARVTQLTDQLTADRQQMRAIHESRTAELRKQLTPEQFAKLIAFRSQGRFGRHGKSE
jgi:Spy/CpxP family protein refolding chaperone